MPKTVNLPSGRKLTVSVEPAPKPTDDGNNGEASGSDDDAGSTDKGES